MADDGMATGDVAVARVLLDDNAVGGEGIRPGRRGGGDSRRLAAAFLG